MWNKSADVQRRPSSSEIRLCMHRKPTMPLVTFHLYFTCLCRILATRKRIKSAIRWREADQILVFAYCENPRPCPKGIPACSHKSGKSNAPHAGWVGDSASKIACWQFAHGRALVHLPIAVCRLPFAACRLPFAGNKPSAPLNQKYRNDNRENCSHGLGIASSMAAKMPQYCSDPSDLSVPAHAPQAQVNRATAAESPTQRKILCTLTLLG
jgi:hypothetical protein